MSLLRDALGQDFERLPETLRRAHDPRPAVELAGAADIDGAESVAGRLIAAAFGFPSAGSGVAAHVGIVSDSGSEVWTRRFGDARFSSRLTAGPAPGRLTESFGPFSFDLAVAADASGFTLDVTGWRLFGVTLPARLAPSTVSRTFATGDGAYGFDVRIDAPLAGRLVRYRGRLAFAGPQRQAE